MTSMANHFVGKSEYFCANKSISNHVLMPHHPILIHKIASERFQRTVTYTGWPNKNGTVDTVHFQDFDLINSYPFSPCWIDYNYTKIIKFG